MLCKTSRLAREARSVGKSPAVAFALAAALALALAPANLSAAVPRFSHVIVIVIENKEFSEVVGNRRMPNFNRWAGQYALLTRYHGVAHPSLPNYLALIAGDFFGIRSDCTDCRVRGATCLPELLEARGRTWKAYLEGLPSPGFTGASSGRYRKKHNPFVYFESLLEDRARLARSVVPFDELQADLDQGRLPDFAFIMPDICNSAHDCSSRVADAWLGKTVGAILGSPAYDASTLLVLTFDEGATNQGCCGSSAGAGGGRVATVLISPLVIPRFRDATPYSHYSLLKTILVAWELELIGHTADADVVPILEPWRRP
jgi:phospholipase C